MIDEKYIGVDGCRPTIFLVSDDHEMLWSSKNGHFFLSRFSA